MSENNEIVDKLTSYLIKTTTLKFVRKKIFREQIQNKSTRIIDYTCKKLEHLSLTLKCKGKWRSKLNQKNPMKITIIGNP